MKKLLSLLLALTLLVSACPAALAIEAGEYDGKTVILHSNDIHGAIEGYASMAALKAQYEAEGAEVILADAGDFSQGTMYVSTSKGADAISLMNLIGYDVVTLGNHEFDYGATQLLNNLEHAEFSVVCSNVRDPEGENPFDTLYSYTTLSGLTVGFFGLATPKTQTSANPALIKGYSFGADTIWDDAQETIDLLKDQEVDIVIALTHLGVDVDSVSYTSYDLLENTTGIDMVLDGHSHTVMTQGKNGETIQSTGTNFENIGVVVIDDETKTIERNELLAVADLKLEANAAVQAAAQKIIDRIDEEYSQVFASSEVTLNGDKAPSGNRDSETNNGDLITDAMMWQVLREGNSLPVDTDHIVAILNGGGIRAAITPGDVTRKDINTVLPFGNVITVVTVSGKALLEALEASTYCTPYPLGGFPHVSGLCYTVDTTKAYDASPETYPGSTNFGPASINRVTITSVNGKAFEPDATYAVITNDFCASGGDTYYALAASENKFDIGIPLDEAVMAYVAEELGGVIGQEYAVPQGRITVISNPFSDIPTGQWFTEPVIWAVNSRIADGQTDTAFAPEASCSRAQFITFLWRAAGMPEPTKAADAFADVDTDAYYAKAVAWAVENGITDGTSDTAFSPSAAVTRSQAVTFLYRYAGKPAATGAVAFPDVVAGEYYYEAVRWAVSQSITDGTSDTAFSPLVGCTRGQAVTFLYRAVAN